MAQKLVGGDRHSRAVCHRACLRGRYGQSRGRDHGIDGHCNRRDRDVTADHHGVVEGPDRRDAVGPCPRRTGVEVGDGRRRCIVSCHRSAWAAARGRRHHIFSEAGDRPVSAVVAEGSHLSRNPYRARASTRARERGSSSARDLFGSRVTAILVCNSWRC